MNALKLIAVVGCLSVTVAGFAQPVKRSLPIKKLNSVIKIDGILDEDAWKDAPLANNFIESRPVAFRKEGPGNASEVYILYNNEGIYIGGYFHEISKDSISAELVGRDGFGNNDFALVVFDTYQDKLNGFEYLVTPLGEQADAKVAPNTNGNIEDYTWNAVWQSAAKIHADGWSFEMFIPFSAIRFGKKKLQNWGLNIMRRKKKTGQDLFWQAVDQNVNGFLTQEGTLTGLENIKPPLRLQLSPYLSTYFNHDGTAADGVKKNSSTVNGGMDVKYGINQAFTLDMTLIPDFGQAPADNLILNLSPFEQRFSENRPFFTEGTELFNKGNLFYSRRIGVDTRYRKYPSALPGEIQVQDAEKPKIINATKISGRTQRGLGIGILNAVTNRRFTVFEDTIHSVKRKVEAYPLTNYNVFVLDQTLKNNSSVSLVNTNVWRSGNDYEANVTSGLFDFNDKKNMWNVGGYLSFSNIINSSGKTSTGYAHNIYFGKTSGRFNFNLWQELYNDRYDKSDLGFFTNNNTMDQGLWAGYNWTKPRGWYNQIRINTNFFYSRLVTPLDKLGRKSFMYQNAGINFNFNVQTKKLWWFYMNINGGPSYNDFYEPRETGRVFHNRGRVGVFFGWEGNSAKKFSWNGNLFTGTGGVFKRKSLDLSLGGKVRFSSKFSVDVGVSSSNSFDQSGYAGNDTTATGGPSIIFSRRDVRTVENYVNLKYNFNTRMGLTLKSRHYWSKVAPLQFYELDKYGDLKTPTVYFRQNVKQNFNYLTVDMVYNWQFAQGSFFSIVFKDIANQFNQQFEKNYASNLSNTVNGPQFSSLSFRVIYFLDYLTVRRKMKGVRGSS